MPSVATKSTSSTVKPNVSLRDFGLNEIYDIIQRRKTLIILSVILMWALGLTYCYYAQQTYESSAQILVMRKDTALATTGAPSKAGSEADIKEELLSTHMQILMSQSIIEEALRQTIKLSDLNKFKTEYRTNEAITSGNLRYALARMFAKEPETPVVDPNAPAATGAEVPAAETAEGANAAAVTPPAVANATEPAVAPPAASAPANQNATTNPESTAAVAGATPTTDVPTLPEADFTTVSDTKEVRKLLTSEPTVLPVGPTADGDTVISLADLPVLMEELDPGDLAQQYIADNLVIARGGSGQMRTSHVLTIALRHPDPVEARLILDAILQSYERFLDAQFRDVSKEASQLIEDASNKIKNDLLKAQTAYQIFREQSPILGSRADGSAANNNIHFEKFNKTHEVLINVGLDLEVARERLREVELKLVDFSKPGVNKWTKLSLIDRENMARIGVLVTANQQTLAVQDPALAALLPSITAAKAGDEQLQINKLLEISGKKDALLKIFGENHPEIQKVNAELEAVKKLIDARSKQEPLFNEKDFKRPEVIDPDLIMDWYLGMLRSDVKVLERRQQELLEEAAQEEELAKGLLPYELEEDRLRQEVQHAQELYDAVIDRLREVNFAKDYSGFVNEIIVNPAFGEEIWPSVPIVMVVASMFGLLAGVFAAAMTEYRDRTFRDPDDIRRDLGMTLLTHIPSLNSKGIDKRQLVEGSKMHATVYAYHRPKSREAEVFRGLRTSLFFSTQGQKCQVIGMTSPNQGDGKSTVTSNLAVSIAQTGRKVLLVDCDLRRPNVHKLLGISNDVGLSDVIGGEMEPWDAIQQTETTNLWSLPSGPLPANPAELLTSATFEQFIKIAREKYDYILLDCPPVLAVADPCIVAPRTDGMTLVLRVSKDSRPQATRAKEMLERVHARMLGVVVNASQEAHKTGYGRYGEASYAQSYDYGYSSKGYSNYNKYYEEDAAATARSKRTGR